MPTAQLANRYTVLDTLGQGAMGVVYLVDDPIAHRMAALKVISAEVGRNERSVLQFKQEFRLMTQLRHPNCCEVYDYGVLADGEPYFTMEIVPGKGLDECIPLDTEKFRQVFSQLMLALGYVHQQGFVHRDLKSMNVRLKPDGTVKLMDYGLMTYVGQANPGISGTVAYMAPEVIKRGPVDPRSDLYSAGCLAYELLTGRCPFERDVPMEVLRAHVNDRPEPPSRLVPNLDPQLERIVLKLLEKEPIARYQSAFDVLEDLGFEAPPGLGGSLLTSPLVGREGELAALTGRLERTARGAHEDALVLHAPPGMGKSRLVEAFRFAAQLELVPCAVGRAAEQETPPYGPFTTVLRALLPELKAHAPTALERHAPVLVKLLSELRVAPAAEMDHPNREKMRLQGAIAEVLTALARTRPIAIVLEDWHWADDLSRDMLDYLLRNRQSAPMLVLVTTRETPPAALASRATLLALPPLAPGELGRMVGSMLGTREVEPGFLKRLHALSEGSPLYLERLLDHLVKRGILTRLQGRWNMEVEFPQDAVLENLTHLLADRLAIMPPPAIALARAAAVAGADFDLALLKDVTGFGDDELFDALSELERHRLLVQSRPGAYRFAQDLVRNLVYTQLDEAERKRLHGRIARSLEAELWIMPLPEVPFEQITAIANHCLLSDLPESAITYALEAGRRDAALYAIPEATRFLEAGLALVEADGSPVWDSVKLGYLRQLGDLRRVTGQSQAATEVYKQAIAFAERLGERASMGHMLTSLAKLQQEFNDLPGALANFERALAIAVALDDKAGAARCLDASCRARYFSGDAAGALAEAERALAYATEASAPVLAHILAFYGYLCVASSDNRIAEGITHLRRAIAAFQETGDPIGLNNAVMLLGNAHCDLGEYQEAWDCFSQARAICERIAYRAELTFAVLNMGQVALERGQFTETARLAAESQALAGELGARYQEGLALLLAAAAGCQTGEIDLARRQLETALEHARALKHRLLETLMRQFQLEVELHLHDLPAARRAAEALETLIAETGFTPLESKLKLGLAWIAAREGRAGDARAALAAASTDPKFALNRVNRLRACKLEAWLLVQEGAFDEAHRLAAEALEEALSLDHPFHRAELSGLLGEIALARGDAATPHFDAMAAVAETSGAAAALAAAHFGRAAAQPLAPEAAQLAAEARNDLAGLLAGTSEATRAAFLASRERKRVWEGDYHAFSRPVAKQADAAAARNQSFGGMGPMM